MARLDPELRNLLYLQDLIDKDTEGKDQFPSILQKEGEPIYIAIICKGPAEQLASNDFEAGDITGNVAFGKTTLKGLKQLAQHPHIISIEKQRKSKPGLNDSIPDIKANTVWSRVGAHFTGYTGKDIIIGIIDTGIDFKHRTFRHADGKTRILKIWDQTLTAQGGETVPGPITHPTIATTPTPLGYGVEYDTNQINDTLENSSPAIKVRHKDDGGHGTHVAGIAVGNGGQAGGCHSSYTYIGVAPRADIMVVRLWGLTKGDPGTSPTSSSTTLDAIKYLFEQARLVNKPLVINISFGRFTDRMDGTSSESQAIDTLLNNNSTGRAISIIAGNSAHEQFHAKESINNGAELELKFKISSEDKKWRHITIYYPGTSLQVQLESPVGGANGTIPYVSSGNIGSSTTANGGADSRVSIFNNPGEITITIKPLTDGTNKNGTWLLKLKNTGTTPITFDAFCLFGSHDEKNHYFLNHINKCTTLWELGTTKEVITVGSYKVDGGLAHSSGRGPTLDTRTDQKPDITAPGVGIKSAGIEADRNNIGDYLLCKKCCCQCCEDYYVTKNGTSMAGPHVAGLIALMLNKNPNLTHTQIKSLIRNNTRPKPSNPAPQDDCGWGQGKLDAEQVMAAVTQVNPPISSPNLPFTEVIPDHFQLLQERFEATPRGKEFIRMFNKYFDEIRSLINTNKKVATVWHRIKGPIWVRLGIKATTQPDTPVPLEIEGYTLHEGIDQFLPIVKRFASEELMDDINKYYQELILIKDGMSLNDLIEVIGYDKKSLNY